MRDVPYRSADMAHLHVAINLSTAQLGSPGLAACFIEWLAGAGQDAQNLQIEFAESALLELSKDVVDNLHGLGIWLDDFGTGYSSLRHLRDLPISGLKVDKSFVMNLEDDTHDFRIVSAIARFACA